MEKADPLKNNPEKNKTNTLQKKKVNVNSVKKN